MVAAGVQRAVKAAWTKVYKGIFEALKVWTWSIVETRLEATLITVENTLSIFYVPGMC